jgi:archaeosine synthase beta-subunit
LKKKISSQLIKHQRPLKQPANAFKPYLFFQEEEIGRNGVLQKVNTIFLTNRECPFTCVMCDLWRHTLDEPTPAGAIPEQIRFALERLPDADTVKLYNSGNFFDGKAIPVSDYERIAEHISMFEHVVVENHPKLIGGFIPSFRDMIAGSLEIAMGLETVHPGVLPKLNKQMSTEDFAAATHFLAENEIDVRAFILLNPPFLLGEKENKKWCLESVRFAFDNGVTTCSIIPTRDGNGIMEKLREQGTFQMPTLKALEDVFDEAILLDKGRVFCDLWDLERFTDCKKCLEMRKERLNQMNLSQKILPRITCDCMR